MNLFFRKLYSFFNTILIKKKIPIIRILKSLRKGPDINDNGNSAIKYDGKLINIFSLVINIKFNKKRLN